MSIVILKLQLLQKSMNERMQQSDTFDEILTCYEKDLYDKICAILAPLD